jgi:hypothetical protein
MGPLITAGGILVGADKALSLTNAIDTCCEEAGFPIDQEFKWSPGRELWMRNELKGEKRVAFFESLFAVALAHEVTAIVVIEDTSCQKAITSSSDHAFDTLILLLERVAKCFSEEGGIFVVDLPGSPKDEFSRNCTELFDEGTTYVDFKKFVLPVTTLPSRMVRLLQLSDVVTSCTTSFVSGEDTWSPRTFAHILPLIRSESDRKGGCGLKLHPDMRYLNLYHWLLEDSYFIRNNVGSPLPISDRKYAKDATTP